VILGPTTVSNFPTPFSNLGVNGFLGIQWLSWSVAIFAVLAVAFGVTLRMTPLGRSLYAIGNNQEAAFSAGIRVKRIKLGLFVLGGVSIFGGTGTILGVALAAFVYAGLRSALLLTSSFNENDFQVVSGGLLILSVLIPNIPSFVQRVREMGGRRRLRGEAAGHG
jgi:rhamnose transport system permease protein